MPRAFPGCPIKFGTIKPLCMAYGRIPKIRRIFSAFTLLLKTYKVNHTFPAKSPSNFYMKFREFVGRKAASEGTMDRELCRRQHECTQSLCPLSECIVVSRLLGKVLRQSGQLGFRTLYRSFKDKTMPGESVLSMQKSTDTGSLLEFQHIRQHL